MKSLAETMAQLGAKRAGGSVEDRLHDIADFGLNPGALRARAHVPNGLKPGAALVVVLHGCTQTAAGYDHGTGWSRLADRHGFALLFPEQTRANNPNLCFNWFQPEDTQRGRGEPESIRQMIAAMTAAHAIDPERIFVTGLSAGGAMTSVMLATYPELFAGGAVIAGLPYGVAGSVPQALERMRSAGGADAAALGRLVRAASPHDGPWPTVAVWHGSGDATVNPDNADAIVAQWRGVHGLGAEPSRRDTVDGQAHRSWCDAAGRVLVEDYRIAGLAHGVPLAATGADPCGVAGAFMLEAGIASTRHIAAGWGLIGEPVRGASTPNGAVVPKPTLVTADEAARVNPRLERIDATMPRKEGVGKVIEDALRAAGLMR